MQTPAAVSLTTRHRHGPAVGGAHQPSWDRREVTPNRTGKWRGVADWRLAWRSSFCCPYAWAPVYRFPEPAPFTGSQLWNPCATLSGRWERATHAHGRGGSASPAAHSRAVPLQRAFTARWVTPSRACQTTSASRPSTASTRCRCTARLPISGRTINWQSARAASTGSTSAALAVASEQQCVIDRVKKGRPDCAEPSQFPEVILARGAALAHRIRPDRSRETAPHDRG